MSRSKRFRLSPAGVIACLALLVALGGVGFAATPDSFRATTPGPGDVYTAYNDGPLELTAARFVATLSLPSGKYVLWGKTYVRAGLKGRVKCILHAGQNDDETISSVPRGEYAALTNTVTTTLTAALTQVELQCQMLQGAGRVYWVKLHALRAANLTIKAP
jgi:hypothetical protein